MIPDLNRRALLAGLPAMLLATRAGAQGTAEATAQLASQPLTVAEHGFAARLWMPTAATGVAVVVLNGSNGGYPAARIGRSLAQAGHPTLALAYFSGANGAEIPDLPRQLRNIPLEYFYNAIDWLKAHTGKPVAVIGESRGAELALLLGTRRSDLAGIVAFAPGTAVWQAPTTSFDEKPSPAWTETGRPLPALAGVMDPKLSSNERFDRALAKGMGAARIPVEQIRARVLLIAGKDDRIWSAKAAADDIAAQARRAGRPEVMVLSYPGAGHLLMGPGPGLTRFVGPGFTVEFGGTDEGNRAARDDAWSKTLLFLAALRRRQAAR